MAKLRVENGELRAVVKSGYGQDMYTDVESLYYNPLKDVFEGRIWDGNFGPGNNTTWHVVPYTQVVEEFGEEVAESLK
jgi:hypothetical protein